MTKLLFSFLFTVVFWNLENFFDWKNDGYSQSDADFSSRGAKYWTYEKCRRKALSVGKTFLWAGSCRSDGATGTIRRNLDGATGSASYDPPEIIGVAEVENARVMGMLVHSDALRKYGYAYVHFDSRDRRGIDVALMYRREKFDCLRKYPVRIVCSRASDAVNGCGESGVNDGNGLQMKTLAPDTLQTRDILHVVLRSKEDGSLWHIFVNHHPSKLGGDAGRRNRLAAMSTLRRCVDSVRVAPNSSNSEPSATLRCGVDSVRVAPNSSNSEPSATLRFGVDSVLVVSRAETGTDELVSCLGAGIVGTVLFCTAPERYLRRCESDPVRAGIIAMGDFNDTPDGPAFALMQGALINLGAYFQTAHPPTSGIKPRGDTTESAVCSVGFSNSSDTGRSVGSIRHNGLWQLIDNFLTDSLTASRATMEVLAPAFLLERDKKYPGLKPRRTYIGPRYNGGLSDHLPVRLNIQ